MSDGRIDEAAKYRAPAFLHGAIGVLPLERQEFASLIFRSTCASPVTLASCDDDVLTRSGLTVRGPLPLVDIGSPTGRGSGSGRVRRCG